MTVTTIDRPICCPEPTGAEQSGCQAICQLHSLRCTGFLKHSGSHNCPGGSGHTF